jgi:hypothetical protein
MQHSLKTLLKTQYCGKTRKIKVEMVMTRKSEHNINKISSNGGIKKKQNKE